MSERTDPVDLVFDLATELSLLVDAAHQVMTSKEGIHAALLLLDQRKREGREALMRFQAWCDEGPDA